MLNKFKQCMKYSQTLISFLYFNNLFCFKSSLNVTFYKDFYFMHLCIFMARSAQIGICSAEKEILVCLYFSIMRNEK